MMEAMRAGCLDALDNSVENIAVSMQLVDIITHVEKKQGIVGLKHKNIPTLAAASLKWHEQAIFKKPGIRTIDGEFYHCPPETDVANFGYRLGTVEEAKALHYMKSRVKQPASLEDSLSFHRSSSFASLLAPSKSLSNLFTPSKSTSDLNALATPPPPYKSPLSAMLTESTKSLGMSSSVLLPPAGSDNEVEELRQLVLAQQTAMADMQKRLEQMEAMMLMVSAKVFPK